jgi:hypothetical protein
VVPNALALDIEEDVPRVFVTAAFLRGQIAHHDQRVAERLAGDHRILDRVLHICPPRIKQPCACSVCVCVSCVSCVCRVVCRVCRVVYRSP